MSAKRETGVHGSPVMIPGSWARGRGAGPRGKRQADRSDVRQENTRLKKARSGVELKPCGRAPALHALRVSHDPCLLRLIPSLSPNPRRMRPLSVGHVTTPFIQRCSEHNTNKSRLSRKVISCAATGDTCFISRFGPFFGTTLDPPATAWAKQLEIEASVTGMPLHLALGTRPIGRSDSRNRPVAAFPALSRYGRNCARSRPSGWC